MKIIEIAEPESVEPIPVKRLDDHVVFVDGTLGLSQLSCEA
jgi:hypothetical protein